MAMLHLTFINCFRHHMIENDVHKSSCVETYYQTGRQGQKENVLLEVFSFQAGITHIYLDLILNDYFYSCLLKS